MSLRERKKQRTRERLVHEGLRLFAEQGYEQTSVEEITEAADVSPRTFFRYFPTKADIVFADMPGRLVALQAALERDDRSVHLLVRDVLVTTAGLLTDDRTLLAARARLVLENPPLHSRLLEFFATIEGRIAAAYARQNGRAPEALAPRLAAAITVAAGRSAMLAWRLQPRLELADMLHSTFALTAPAVKKVLRDA